MLLRRNISDDIVDELRDKGICPAGADLGFQEIHLIVASDWRTAAVAGLIQSLPATYEAIDLTRT